jgi:hypothetical protein
MESAMKSLRRQAKAILAAAVCAVTPLLSLYAQDQAPAGRQEGPAQLRLERTVRSREYQGKTVEGEERVIRPRDTLWGILVRERGLSEKRFNRYVVLIGALNPDLKRPDVLRVGDTLFIPLQPDEVLEVKVAGEKDGTRLYRVKRGDQLFKVLRQQLGIQGKAELKTAAEQVKGLNPGKKNWDNLLAGETIRLPSAVGSAPQMTAKQGEVATAVVGLDYGQKISAQENLNLLALVMGALGQETSREGEEVVPLREETIHIDRNSYPVIRSPKKGQRVILDMQSKITPSLRSKLEADTTPMPVVSLKKGASLHEAVSGLLSRLGFQSLPPNRPVVVQDGGVAVQVRGEWMVVNPEEKGGGQELLIITLTDSSGQTPDYLKDYLALKGTSLREILLPSSSLIPVSTPSLSGGAGEVRQIESWPADKAALVDALLREYNIAFQTGQQLSAQLREGIRAEAKVDRSFEYKGKKLALSFRALGADVKKSLQEQEGIRALELDLPTVSPRDLIARLLALLGEEAGFRGHRFLADEKGARDKLVVIVAGFFLPQRSLLLTDQEIPKEFQRFFAEKGIRIVRFQ